MRVGHFERLERLILEKMVPESSHGGFPAGTPALSGHGGSTLLSRNVTVAGRRTSLRLEQPMWDAMAEICLREGVTLGQLCQRIDERRRESSLTAAIRVYALSYYRAATTEEGHAAIGHGTFRSGGKLDGRAISRTRRPGCRQ
jgi:predicted DNA-binding ribbon-helix-helix protein